MTEPWLLARGQWPGEGMISVRLEVPGGARAATEARHGVILSLGHALSEDEQTDLELLVSELVTNAVRHGGMSGPEDLVVVLVAVGPERTRLEVCDRGAGFEPGRPAPRSMADGGGGFGLVLLERMAEAWGVGAGEEGVCVWAEFSRLDSVDGTRLEERAA